MREVDAEFADQAVGVDDFAAAAAGVFAGAIGVSRCEGCRFEANAAVYFVKKYDKGCRFAELLISHAAHRYSALWIHRYVNACGGRVNVAVG